MDIDDLRTAMTVVSFVVFLAIVAWAYGRGRKNRFDAAAQLPFSAETSDAVKPAKFEGER